MDRSIGKFFVCAVLFSVLQGCAAQRAEQTPQRNAGGGAAMTVSPEGADAAEPAIAAAPDGRVYTAYVQKRGEGGDLFVRSMDPASKTMSEPVRVNPAEGEAKSWYGDPPTLAVGPAGELFVGWTGRYPDSDKGTILYLSASRDGGRSFEPPVRVNDDAEPASHGMHSMAVGSGGSVYFAWLDERYLNARKARKHFFHHQPSPSPTPKPDEPAEPNAELYFAASADGGRTFGRNVRVAADVCPCCKTAVVADGKGGVFVGFRKVYGEFRHIAVAASADGGSAFGEPVQVSDDRWKINACPVSGPAMRMDGDALAVAWFSGGEAGPQGIYTSRTTDGARSFAPRMLLDATVSGGSPAWAGAKLLWSSDGKIRFGGDGPQASEAGEGKNVVAARGPDGRVHYAFVETAADGKAVRLRSE